MITCTSRSIFRIAPLCLVLLVLSCAARTRQPQPPGPRPTVLHTSEGLASFYGREFQGKMTASGVRFDRRSFTAAHPTFPFGTLVRVTNLGNGRTVKVRIVDRGPTRRLVQDGVIVDLSYAAARALRFVQDGRARVRLDVLEWGR